MRRRLLAVLLILLLATPAFAEPAPLFSDAVLEQRLTVTGLAAGEQGLYILTMEEGLHLWEGTGEAPRVVLPAGQAGPTDMLVGDGQRAWLIRTYQGEAYALTWQDGGAVLLSQPIALDLADIANPDGILMWEHAPQSACVVDGTLFWLTEQGRLFAFDLLDGSRTDHDVPNLRWLAAGPEGSLLALYFDQVWHQDAGAFSPPRLVKLEPHSGQWTDLGALPVAMGPDRPFVPFVYDDGADAVLYTVGAGLYRLPLGDETPVLAAHLVSRVQAGAGLCSTPLSLLTGGRAAIATDSGIQLADGRGEAPALLELTLSDTNGWLYFEGAAVGRAAIALSHIKVVKQAPFRDQEDFALKLVTGIDQPDIYLLSTGQDTLSGLIDKGYLADLSSSESLSALAASAWPGVQQAATRDEALFALPISLSFGTWITRDNALKQAGLQVPEDFFAYCDMLDMWYGGLMDLNPQWTPQPATQDPVGDVAHLAYDLYVQHMRGAGEKLRFDTDLFQRMMGRALSFRPDGETQEALETEAAMRTGAAVEGALDIMSTKSSYMPALEHVKAPDLLMAEFAVQPAAEQGLAPAPRGELTVLAVNPRSENREAAISYLEAYAAAMEWQDSLMLGLTEARDIVNPDYARIITGMEQEAVRLRDALKNLEGGALREAQDRLARHQSWLEQSRETERLLLTRQEGDTVRRKASAAYIRDVTQTPEYHPTMVALLERLISGGIELNMFIIDANQRLRLIEREVM